MKKLIFILSLFLMVSLISFGKITRQKTKEFYNFLSLLKKIDIKNGSNFKLC